MKAKIGLLAVAAIIGLMAVQPAEAGGCSIRFSFSLSVGCGSSRPHYYYYSCPRTDNIRRLWYNTWRESPSTIVRPSHTDYLWHRTWRESPSCGGGGHRRGGRH